MLNAGQYFSSVADTRRSNITRRLHPQTLGPLTQGSELKQDHVFQAALDSAVFDPHEPSQTHIPSRLYPRQNSRGTCAPARAMPEGELKEGQQQPQAGLAFPALSDL